MTQVEAPAVELFRQGPKDEFALVCYLPGALGGFLDVLRAELVRDCSARSHVTLLPPRPINGLVEPARVQLRQVLPDFPPFVVELGQVSVFEFTRVIYLELVRGQESLERIHGILNANALHYNEPFEYHPHVTLAQGMEPEYVESSADLARHRWRNYTGPRSFLMNDLVFVQNTSTDDWLDLEQLHLSASTAPALR